MRYGGPEAYAAERARQAEHRKRQCPLCHLRALLIENASGRPMCPACLGRVVVTLTQVDLTIPGLREMVP